MGRSAHLAFIGMNSGAAASLRRVGRFARAARVRDRVSLEAPTGIEPVASSGHALEPNLWAWVERQAADAVRLYRPRFDVGDGL
jgi:hypothetical protein